MAKTVIGLFDNLGDAQAAVRALVARGVPQDEIGFMADRQHELPDTEQLNESEGAVAGAVRATLAVPGVGLFLAAGPIAAALAGGLIGGFTRLGVSEEQAHYYAEALRRGGILVTVPAERPAQAELAMTVLHEQGREVRFEARERVR